MFLEFMIGLENVRHGSCIKNGETRSVVEEINGIAFSRLRRIGNTGAMTLDASVVFGIQLVPFDEYQRATGG